MITQLQIIPISGTPIVMPEVKNGAFSCYPDMLRQNIEMISGRIVTEIRGTVYRVTADYSDYYFTNDFWVPLSAILRSGASFSCEVLPDDAAATVTTTMMVESITPPSFQFGRNGTPYWTGLKFNLREVSPHA